MMCNQQHLGKVHDDDFYFYFFFVEKYLIIINFNGWRRG
jgi:hypothetical protein